MPFWKNWKHLFVPMKKEEEKEVKSKFLPTDWLELPPDLQPVMQQAKRYEWLTLGYLVTVILVMYLTLSASQAMKAAWVEDMLGLIPSATFLVSSRFFNRKSSTMYPYSFHRVFSLGFAFGAFALLGIGIFITIDSVISLIHTEHPTIAHKDFFGYHLWFGWVMILALIYSFIPSMILGRKKVPLANKLHNKLLNVDAETQKADWMTAGAAMVGIIGTGFGWWWADPVAALFISVSVLKDGIKQLYAAITDFLGQIPTTVKDGKIHPLNKTILNFFERQSWVKDVRIRLREEGEVFLGEVFVLPATQENLIEHIQQCHKEVKQLDWKIHEITIQPVLNFDFGANAHSKQQ